MKIKNLYSIALALLLEISSSLTMQYFRLYFALLKLLAPTSAKKITALPTLKSNTLIICIHGFLGSPLLWNTFKKQAPAGAAIYTPELYKKGNTDLNEVQKHIFDELSTHIERNDIKLIHLVGYSLGGVVALLLENPLLEKFPKLEITTTTIASPIQGTQLANLVLKIISKPPFISRLLLTQISYKSEFTSNLEASLTHLVKREHYLAEHDIVVYPHHNQSKQHFIQDNGHNSIMLSIMKRVAKKTFDKKKENFEKVLRMLDSNQRPTD